MSATNSSAEQRRIIQLNVANWQEKRRRRERVIQRRSFSRHFNSVGDLMKGGNRDH